MKKHHIPLLCLAVLLALSSCHAGGGQTVGSSEIEPVSSESGETAYSRPSEEASSMINEPGSTVPIPTGPTEAPEAAQERILKLVDNTADWQKTDRLDEKAVEDWYNRFYFAGFSYGRVLLGEFDQKVPIRFLRQVDDLHYYTMYKIGEKGRLYIFFERDFPRPVDLITYACSVYSEKRLAKSDFDRIKAGDSLEKVIAIDPTARFAKNKYSMGEEGSSVHLLSDGILKFSYTKKENTFVVSEVVYNSEGILPKRFHDYHFRVLPQDLISE